MHAKTKTMQDLTDRDKVLGTDGKWHSIKVLPIEEKQMYEFMTSEGNVTCSYDHKWKMFLGRPKKYSTEHIYKNIDRFKGVSVGIKNGAYLIDIKPLSVDKCRCIRVDSDDHQFAVLTDRGKKLFTSNCAGRIACGNVSSVASQMALDNSLGTTIKGDHKGAGIYSVNKEMTNIQFYYADQKWIKDWYNERGLDDKGYPQDKKEEGRPIVLDDEDEELHLSHDNITYEFQDEKKEIANQKEQHFETVK